MGELKKPIIFFDGVCGLCNSFIDFLIKKDKKRFFYIASLQGLTAQKIVPEKYRMTLQTVVLYDEKGKIQIHSSAVLRILTGLGGFYKITMIAYLIPAFIRDYIYKKISQKRYGFFGKKSTCRLPTKEEKCFFLD